MLVAGGATVNMQDNKGMTPRLLALQADDHELAAYLESKCHRLYNINFEKLVKYLNIVKNSILTTILKRFKDCFQTINVFRDNFQLLCKPNKIIHTLFNLVQKSNIKNSHFKLLKFLLDSLMLFPGIQQ